MSKTFYKNGLLIIKDDKFLLCEPYAYKWLIMPGGLKREGESIEDNISRQVKEELGEQAALNTNSLKFIGTFEDISATNLSINVVIDLYSGKVTGQLTPSSEIKNLVWATGDEKNLFFSAIIKNKIIPFLNENKYIT